MKRAFKYRFYPTSAQAAELSRAFGCVRKVCNLALAARAEAWRVSRTRVGSAFVGFWAKRTQHPRCKSKRKSRASAEYTRSAFRHSGGRLTLAKTAEPLDIVWSRPLPQGVSRKEKGSNNRAKACTRVARIHARIADRRRDHLHKLTTRLVRENHTLVIEDLVVRNMVKNHKLARAIHDASWRELRSVLEHKAAWYGRELITVDRWFPSTRLCSVCGALAPAMPLSVREWTCEGCGATHDRDGNAAANLLTAGLAAAACGADVRPHRESFSRSGRSVVKQETPPARAGIHSP
ncbi:RNA-guided endonuclease InsQ/TnpB family protein [Streptomyces sp. NRRL S-244]|uniref:RNA-guided endonuclease InsQ/TnpB family protein n=1 Tax=Streptomyces sp. NRRL S-244 TaxID=1463897 RepID=UPI0004BF1BC2|nr:RNA-guided endonuclease TnpB family protein [Streptomyces sp. NRRL S-244]